MELNEDVVWDGRRIACGRAGTGPPVVFCHGTPWSSTVWSPFADALAGSCTVHVWDMPGYGRSSMRPQDPVDLRTQSAAFAAVLAHWGLERPHVVAHDIGGAVALLAGGARYASLLLVDVVAIPPVGSPFFRLVQEHPDTLAQLPPAIHEAVVRAYIAGASHRGLRPDDLDALARPWLTDDGRGAFYRQIAQFDGDVLDEIEGRLGGLTMPARVLWGTDDAWIPLRTGRRLASLLPGADLVEIPGAGHLVQYDQPVALANLVRAWVVEQTT